MIEEMGKKADAEESQTVFDFTEFVDGVPRYEVCRMFLTSLFLCNQGNLDFELKKCFKGRDGEDRVSQILLHLLDRRLNFGSLMGEGGEGGIFKQRKKQKKNPKDVAGAVEGPDDGAGGRGRGGKRRSRKSMPIQDGPASSPIPLPPATVTPSSSKKKTKTASSRTSGVGIGKGGAGALGDDDDDGTNGQGEEEDAAQDAHALQADKKKRLKKRANEVIGLAEGSSKRKR